MKRIFIISVAILAAFAACKKEVAPGPTCKINKSIIGKDTTSFSYNSEGKLSTVSRGKITTTYAYSSNIIIASSKSSGTFSSKKIITLNESGLASNVREERDVAGTNWTNTAYEYNSTELTKYTITSSSGGTPSIHTFTWNGGNMTALVDDSSTTNLEYYADKPSQTGDYLDFVQLFSLGYKIYKTKNALKALYSGSDIINFDYTLDAQGKIVALIATGPSITTINYQYQCN